MVPRNSDTSDRVIALFTTASTATEYWQAERAVGCRMSDLSPEAMRVMGQAFYRCISPNDGATTHASPALIAIAAAAEQANDDGAVCAKCRRLQAAIS